MQSPKAPLSAPTLLAGAVSDPDPREALRRVALGLFDAIDAHIWISAELSLEPWRPALLDFYESVGRLLDALAIPSGHASTRPARS
ncbi:hypothetical protein GCM10029978_065060 [Actinoallomurus acanthiterrae]